MALVECRICDNCGEQNAVSLLECSKCGCDLSFIPPTIIDDSIKEDKIDDTKPIDNSSAFQKFWVVSLTDNSVGFSISDRVTVGREGNVIPEFFDRSNYVSREHATLYISDQKLFVIDASTNGTFINGNRLKKLQAYEIKQGDSLDFADLKFKVEQNAD